MAITARNCCPGPECEPKLAAWCAAVGIPRLRSRFRRHAARRARGRRASKPIEVFPATKNSGWTPTARRVCRKLAPASPPKDLAEFESGRFVPGCRSATFSTHSQIAAEHWTRYTRHFPVHHPAPIRKSAAPWQRYLFTVFGYGCYLGPVQTARHAPDLVTPQTLRRLQRRQQYRRRKTSRPR